MSFLQVESDFPLRLQGAVNSARVAADALPRVADTLSGLSAWIQFISKQFPDSGEDADMFLRNAIGRQGSESVAAWCADNNYFLDPEVLVDLKAFADTDRPDKWACLSGPVAYLFGQAAMDAAIRKPTGSRGLTLPLKFVGNLDAENGIAWTAAKDRLARENTNLSGDVLHELSAEVAIWAKDPKSRLGLIDSRGFQEELERRRRAKGPELALPRNTYAGQLNPVLRPVLMTVAQSNPQLIAELLDDLNTPALIGDVLNDEYRTDESLLTELLKYARPVFGKDNAWTGSMTARLLLAEFEDRCGNILKRRTIDRRNSAMTPLSEQEIDEFVVAATITLLPVLGARHDGPRLVCEWIAHLVLVCALRENNPFKNSRDSLDVEWRVADALIRVLTSTFNEEPWSQPVAVWSLFGGNIDQFPKIAGHAALGERLRQFDIKSGPVWTDQLDRMDRITPFLVAAQFSIARRVATDTDRLAMWASLQLLITRDEPYLSYLSRHDNLVVSLHFAMAIGASSAPNKRLGEIWEAMVHVRLLARSQVISVERKPVSECAAILAVGLAMLQFGLVNASSSEKALLVQLLANILDEFRFSVRESGLVSWNSFVARLAYQFALLADFIQPGNPELFLRRYLGSDEELATVVLNCALDQATKDRTSEAARLVGIDINALVSRIRLWHGKQINEEFVKRMSVLVPK